MILKLIPFLFLIVCVSCTQTKSDLKFAEMLSPIPLREEIILPDSVKTANRNVMFEHLRSNNFSIREFRKYLNGDESVFFGEPWHDVKMYAIPKGNVIGCYTIKHDRYKDYIKNLESKYQNSILAQVYVYKPGNSIKDWNYGDSTETIYSFIITKPDIKIDYFPKIGATKKSIINNWGNPDIETDSSFKYKLEENGYNGEVYLIFHADTLSASSYERLKK